MALALFLFQTATPSPASTPEKLPAWLTLIYLSGLALVALLLLLSLVRNWLRRSPIALTAPANLPKELRKRLGATTTNRGLRAWRWLFALIAIAVFGFHVYWARYAPVQNQKFQELSYKDLRNRRLSESTLRGWIYDRKGRPLAFYKKNNSGDIDREYPMDTALAHIFGTDRGEPGLERALFGTESGAVPEVWQKKYANGWAQLRPIAACASGAGCLRSRLLGYSGFMFTGRDMHPRGTRSFRR